MWRFVPFLRSVVLRVTWATGEYRADNYLPFHGPEPCKGSNCGNVVPPVHMVYINLRDRVSRKNALSQHVKATMWHGPYTLQRLEARTGTLERAFAEWQHPVPENVSWADEVRESWSRPVTLGEVGCSLSHLAALDMLREREDGIKVVLEDDAAWDTSRFADTLHDWVGLLDKYDPLWDVLLLGVPFLTPPQNATHDLVRVGYFYQAHAYAVSSRGLEKIRVDDSTPLVAWDEVLPGMGQAHPQARLNALYALASPLRIYAPRKKLAEQLAAVAFERK